MLEESTLAPSKAVRRASLDLLTWLVIGVIFILVMLNSE
jgi:hypothetical protein